MPDFGFFPGEGGRVRKKKIAGPKIFQAVEIK